MQAYLRTFPTPLIISAILLAILSGLGLHAWHVGQAHWEVAVLRSLQEGEIAGLRPVSIALAIAGTGLPWAALVGAISLALLFVIGLRAAGLLVAAAILQDVGVFLKLFFGRARPSQETVEVWRELSSHSFPSGHVLGATLVFGFLLFALEHCPIARAPKRALQGACVAWMLLMGIGRMQLGAHWPTDVVAGYVTGAILLIPLVMLLGKPRSDAALTASA
jgi:membrane-associated phospholipid phosphatase